MEILNLDARRVTEHILSTSETASNYPRERLVFESVDNLRCVLDPGGCYFGKDPWVSFYVENIEFRVQRTKIDWVIEKMRLAKQRYPGAMRFSLWNWFFILPIPLFNQVLQRLEILEREDETIHAEITIANQKAELQKSELHLDFGVPIEKDYGAA